MMHTCSIIALKRIKSTRTVYLALQAKNVGRVLAAERRLGSPWGPGEPAFRWHSFPCLILTV